MKSGFPSLTHEWSEILDGAVVPLHDQRASKSKVGVCKIGIKRKRLFEQTIGCRAVGRGSPCAHAKSHADNNPRRPCAPVASRCTRWLSARDSAGSMAPTTCSVISSCTAKMSSDRGRSGRPRVAAGGRVDQLGVTRTRWPALRIVPSSTERTPSSRPPANVTALALVGEAGIAGDHEEASASWTAR